ncbi:MAG: Lrp/AsnC family transcriptional regulator [Syntrophobacterales bacterium]|jgi:DNA-binding Lrp family transcriptional regulator|nr:Lrp/AsnC family transcriptional regulator [Syntrophobacterales bacterium]
MDETDRKILNMIQEEFPVASRPFAEIGEWVGISEAEVLERIKKAKKEGYIRRIGPIFESEKLVLTSALCGAHIEEAILMDVAKEINKHKGVTHNYEREGRLNLWFTVTAKSVEEIDSFIGDLEMRFSLKIYRFPKKRVFKIKTYFPV